MTTYLQEKDSGKIRERFKIPVFVGGRALSGKANIGFEATEHKI